MNTMEFSRAELEMRLDPIILRHSENQGAIIPLLADIQNELGYLAEEAVTYTSAKTGIPAAEMFGTATFYSMFRFKPQGKYVIKLCRGTACHVHGSALIALMLERNLGIKDGDLTDDGLFSVQHAACLGCCSLAPVMMVNDEAHGRLTPEKAAAVLDKYRQYEQK